MCGINGIVNFGFPIWNADRIIASMNGSISHRGPDAEGCYISADRRVGLGNRLLRIVDITHSEQPWVCRHDDAEYAITFNGEAYNYIELRRKLEALGCQFTTNCDTEAVLWAYIHWGPKFVQRLNGPFAIAIYDGRENLLYLARDRVGIRPLYYTHLTDGTFAFSSEEKALLRIPGMSAIPNHRTLAAFFLETVALTNGCAPVDSSFFRGISALSPATYAILRADGMQSQVYWSIPLSAPKETSQEVCIESIRDTITESVALRMPQEVPFAAALSGGIDSSIVASLLARDLNDPLTCFSLRFLGGPNPDYEAAEILARKKGMRLIAVDLSPEQMLQDVDAMVYSMDAPHDTIRQLGLFAMYRSCSQLGFKVALVGEGADEFLLGYYYTSPGFAADQAICHNSAEFRQLWEGRVRFASSFFSDAFLSTIDYDEIIASTVSQYYDPCQSDDPLDKMHYFYIRKFLKYRLDANDRCGSAHGVEVRVPYCDHEVIHASLQVPHSWNLFDGTEKWTLREAFRDLLPSPTVGRRKYALPECPVLAMHRLIAELTEAEIRAAHTDVWEILNRRQVEEVVAQLAARIDDLGGSGLGTNSLTAEVPLSKPVELRTKHVFMVLTFLRWFKLFCG